MNDSWGWAGTASEFLTAPSEEWLGSLTQHHQRLLGIRPSGFQVDVWREEWPAMTDALRTCVSNDAAAADWGIVFEYELPLEGGRRPDVVVLAGGTVIVLEFKAVLRFLQAHLDQVEAYARDLAEYHEASRGRSVVPILVMRNVPPLAGRREGTTITDMAGIDRYLTQHATPGQIELQPWVESSFAPLPTLVAAARRIFRHEPLPHVRRAESAGIPETVDLVTRLADETEASGGRSLVFVTGVPGSGKTLVGLRVVYERSDIEGKATFLSGNGPLVQVLQDALRSRVFVRDLHAFIRTHGLQQRVPGQHVIVFDEAQRAWDASFMEYKRGVSRSEPEMLIEAGGRVPDWCLLVGLVGEGQEIFSGEEGGIAQWQQALAASGERWTIHCPPRLAGDFAGREVQVHDELDLTVSLRSHRAEELHRWVALLLQGSISLAARQAMRIVGEDTYPMYVTRDLEMAKDYVRARYEGDGDRPRYGILVSSHAKDLQRLGLKSGYLDQRKLKVARWFNAPPDDPLSGCSFEMPVTEFQCQGLEVDMGVVCWGADHRWEASAWKLTPIRRQYAQEDPVRLLQNAYRVLLTRGRDGLVIFVPPGEHMDATAHTLLAAGVRPLPEADVVTAGAPIVGSSGLGLG